MTNNLLEKVQKNLGYPPLQKIDPNTQQVATTAEEDKFGQAAIPAVLTGLYRYGQSDEGATAFLQNNGSRNWVDTIFYDKKEEVIRAISAYGGHSLANSITKMNAIAHEAIEVMKATLPAGASIKEVKLFLSHQRNHILLYLLPSLNIGDLLHDDTLDDNTHKMQGPISSLMQNIGSAFTNPVTDEEMKKKEMNY